MIDEHAWELFAELEYHHFCRLCPCCLSTRGLLIITSCKRLGALQFVIFATELKIQFEALRARRRIERKSFVGRSRRS